MGELISPTEGILPQSREKASLYLKDGRTFVLQHALDHRLGLGPNGLHLAISFSASHYLRSDLLALRGDIERIKPLQPIIPGFLKRQVEENLRVHELARDFLERERERYIQDCIPNHPNEFVLSVRHAIQDRFILEENRIPLDRGTHRAQVEAWGNEWKTKINQTLSGLSR